MTGSHDRTQTAAAAPDALPELAPWREMGWIFRDGECVVVERKGEHTPTRVEVD